MHKAINIEDHQRDRIQWTWKITLDEVVDIERDDTQDLRWKIVQEACKKANSGIRTIELSNVTNYYQTVILPEADSYIHYVVKPSDSYSIYCVGYIIQNTTTIFRAHEDGYIDVDVHDTTEEEREISIPGKHND